MCLLLVKFKCLEMQGMAVLFDGTHDKLTAISSVALTFASGRLGRCLTPSSMILPASGAIKRSFIWTEP